MNSMVKDGSNDGGLAGLSDTESEYLAGNWLGGVSKVSDSNQPRAAPVGDSFDGKNMQFGGWNLQRFLKFRNIVVDKIEPRVIGNQGLEG